MVPKQDALDPVPHLPPKPLPVSSALPASFPLGRALSPDVTHSYILCPSVSCLGVSLVSYPLNKEGVGHRLELEPEADAAGRGIGEGAAGTLYSECGVWSLHPGRTRADERSAQLRGWRPGVPSGVRTCRLCSPELGCVHQKTRVRKNPD